MDKIKTFFALACCLFLATALFAGQNMIGRQSHNEGINVMPAGKVTIDGKLDDWDWSGRIWVFSEKNVRDRYSVEVAAMWDKDYLYLAAKWMDPTPMFNMVDPDYNFDDGWKGDCWQLRIKSDDIVHYTIWNFTEKDQANFHVTYSKKGKGGETFVLKGKNGGDLGRGVQAAFLKTSNKSYNQEVRIHWSLVYRTVPEIKAGLVFRMGNEFLWGDATGRTWPVHRYADNMQAGVTSREFYWQNFNAWGNATLLDQGNIPVRQYQADEDKIQGTFPVRVEIPANAKNFTIAIDDENGNRIRNLAGGCDPMDYTVSVDGSKRTVEVLWDCLDDKGRPVAPGSYQVKGLWHDGLGVEYDMTYYNPGTPPWRTADGKGSWGSNHANARGCARAGENMIVYWGFSEGGHAIICLDKNRKKIWGELTGANELAADANSVYGLRKQFMDIFRMNTADGKYKSFVLDGKQRPFFLPLIDVLGVKPESTQSISSNGKILALAYDGNTIAILDANSAELQKSCKLAGVQDVAFFGDKLYALANGKLNLVDMQTGKASAIPTPGLGKGTRIATDLDGNIVVVDSGPDSQLKIYSPEGTLVYTAGKKGGRPWSGIFDEQAMMMMASIDVDYKGDIWVAESWRNPRRISIWGKDGKLVQDFVGGSGYAGTCSWLDEKDPSLGYFGPVEMKIDHQKGTYKTTRILWAPDQEKNQAFPLWRDMHWFSNPHELTSSASGKPVRYIYFNGVYSQWHVICIDDGVSAKPVAALANPKYLSEALPNLDLGTKDRKEAVIWCDKNGDAAVTKDECTLVGPLNLYANWGNRLASDLSFYLSGVTRIKPVGFTDKGAPIYTKDSIIKLDVDDQGQYLPIPGEKAVISCSTKGYPKASTIFAFNPDNGKIAWSYPNPFPGVHGSHMATMPEPGLIIGSLKLSGIADINDQIGKVFAIRGNLGQDYFLTTDGLFVGSVFQDGRLPGDALPNTEAELKKMPMEGFSEGGEPFSGWFGKQNDGRVRMLTSLSRRGGLIVYINGLESIQRLKPFTIQLDEAVIAKANSENAKRKAAADGLKKHQIAKMQKAPKIDGNGKDWSTVQQLIIERKGSPNKGSLKIAYDNNYLYVLFDISDPTPWMNEGKDFHTLFKSGDALDIQIGKGTDGKIQEGDQRIVFGLYNDTDVAVLMRPLDKSAKPEMRYVYSSPVTDKPFDRVEIIPAAIIKVNKRHGQYTLEAAIPLQALKISARTGNKMRGDFGIISSDATGKINAARTYWANKNTNLVNDLPTESVLFPKEWGVLEFE